MGFLLTVIYVALSHLSPADMFPSLSDDRIMLWLAIGAVVATVPSIVTRKFPFRAPEVYLMLGVLVAVPVSRLVNDVRNDGPELLLPPSEYQLELLG